MNKDNDNIKKKNIADDSVFLTKTSNKTKVIVIVGPTASGKSDVAIELAKRIDSEIVSADSMQIYRGMDIGTAKVTPDEMRGIRHHLIDVVNPSEQFSAAEYQIKARSAIEDIALRGKIPILAGGTGLYVRAVIDKLEFPKGVTGSDTRKHLEERAAVEGKEALYRELIEKDPGAADIVHPANLRRIIRALEVIEVEKRPFSEFHTEWSARESIYDVKMFGLTMNRTVLKERIDMRVDKMIELGLVDEVKHMLDYGFEGFLTSLQAIGYKELIDYLNGKVSLKKAIETTKIRTRQYAKRQLTWFGADHRIRWIAVNEKSALQIADEIITELGSFLT
jgi:tRNA dimethylallyltransferase